MTRLHPHPDGHSIDFADNRLTVVNSDGKAVSIPIGTYGLLILADALESVAGEKGVTSNE